MRRTLRIARFVAIQALVLLLVAETSLRVLRPAVANLRVALYMPSISGEFAGRATLPELLDTTILGFNPYTARAGFVTNSRGFRTPEYADEKSAGAVRIVAIGDSFTFSSGGIPWSLGWQHLLQQRLEPATPGDVELISLGVPGVGPLFEQRLWQIEGARLSPDVMLFVFFVGNDFTDHFQVGVDRSFATRMARMSYVARLIRNLARIRSGSVAAPLEMPDDPARTGADPSRGGFEIPEYLDAFATRAPWYSHERMVEVEANRARLCERAQSEAFDELFERLAAILRDFHAEVEAAGTDFRMVILPDRVQVNLDEQHEALAFLGMNDRDFDWDKPQRRLREFLDREGIAYLDLLPAFRAESGQMFDPGNTHWNVPGNAFVAERVAEWLAPQLPLP